MSKKLKLILATLMVSLTMSADISLPSSMLSIDNAYRYAITSTDTAIAIVDEMREHSMEPDWKLDEVEGDIYFNARRYRRALPYYRRAQLDKTVKSSPDLLMAMIKGEMSCSDILLDESLLTKSCYDLMNIARKEKSTFYQAHVLFIDGKWRHRNGEHRVGLKSCLKAVNLMEDCDEPLSRISLRHFYFDLVELYSEEGRFGDAFRLSTELEQEIRNHPFLTINLYDDHSLRNMYAQRASLLSKMSRLVAADSAYAKWKSCRGGNAIDDKHILTYLISRQHYDEALNIMHTYQRHLTHEGDSLTQWMLTMVNLEGKLHYIMGEYQAAADDFHQYALINMSLVEEKSKQQLQTSYELLEKKDESTRTRLFLTVLVAILSVGVVAFGIVSVYSVRIKRRNKVLLNVLAGLDAYRNAVIKGDIGEAGPSDKPSATEVSENSENSDASMISEVSENSKSSENPESSESIDRSRNEDGSLDYESIFVQMDKVVTRDKLFLNPNLNREDLMRLTGLDKNRFSRMISKYSDANNTSVYINVKRVEYGSRLLLAHPEYNIAFIAEQCGMTNTTSFNRIFRFVYGMTPSEYRIKNESVGEN